MFVHICRQLTRDEILFWSRSEELLKEILVAKPKRLDRMFAEKPLAASGEVYNLDMAPNKTLFELFQNFADTCTKLSPWQLNFWLRSEERLCWLMTKGEISFLSALRQSRKIPELSQSTNDHLYGAPFRIDRLSHLDTEDYLPKTYPATFLSKAFPYEIACDLHGSEAIRYMSEEEDISASTFTPAQIRFVVQKQCRGNADGPLSYTRPNYFPIIGKNAETYFVSVVWSTGMARDWDQSGEKNKWKIWTFERDWLLKKNGRLFLL